MTGTCSQLSVAYPNAVVISLFIVLMPHNVMHSVLSPLLNLSHTTTWTGFVTVYSTWLAGDWGRAIVLCTTLLRVLLHPLIPISLDHFRSTRRGCYNNFYVKQAVSWQKALDISLHYDGLQALVACGVKW